MKYFVMKIFETKINQITVYMHAFMSMYGYVLAVSMMMIFVGNTPVEASKSCVGAYAESIHDHSKPTMTLDLRNMTYHSMKATILHEFGHALGLGHEHQHPEFWKVMKKFFNISALQVCSQIESIPEFRQKYKGIDEGSFFKGTYDKMSVMHYP